MNFDEHLNAEDENNSNSGNFSTSQSTHSRNAHMLIILNKQGPAENRPLQLQDLREPEEDPKLSSNKEQESDHCDRLFTFMDEKEVEKKIIRDYIFKNTKNKPTNLNMNRDRDSHKAKKSEAIVKMVEGSRQKHERTLIKISPNTSIGKLNRISRSRTPKHLSFIESKLQPAQHKSLLRTPKMEAQNKTPQLQTETRLFRAKSSLGKQKMKLCNENKRKQEAKENNEDLSARDNQTSKSNTKLYLQKELIRKKKDLEKQLAAVNESLVCCKKTDSIKKRGKVGKMRPKASKSRLAKL